MLAATNTPYALDQVKLITVNWLYEFCASYRIILDTKYHVGCRLFGDVLISVSISPYRM